MFYFGNIQIQTIFRFFDTDSLYRQKDLANDGVTLLIGRHRDYGLFQVITALFDRSQFIEYHARQWWLANKHKYDYIMPPP